MKLNLGAGRYLLTGYVNLDSESCIFPLDYRDADEIRASHVLEHFDCLTSVDAVCQWASCLKPGGVLKVAVPDFDDLVRRMRIGETLDYEGIIMGGQIDEYDYHKSIWTYYKLKAIMEGAGLTDIRTWQSEIEDCASLPFSLNLMGVRK